MLNVCFLPASSNPRQHCCLCSVDDFSFINGLGMMTAQERKDFRRVHSVEGDVEKAGGSPWRRPTPLQGETPRSRPQSAKVARPCLAAEHRLEQLEVENHQLQSALTRAPEPSTIDNTHFF